MIRIHWLFLLQKNAENVSEEQGLTVIFIQPNAVIARATKVVMLPDELVMNKIHIIRGKRVMLDKDLAELYGVTTGNLNLAVKRNSQRFPDDFIFQLTKEEYKTLILQFAISKKPGKGGTRRLPYAFTVY